MFIDGVGGLGERGVGVGVRCGCDAADDGENCVVNVSDRRRPFCAEICRWEGI